MLGIIQTNHQSRFISDVELHCKDLQGTMRHIFSNFLYIHFLLLIAAFLKKNEDKKLKKFIFLLERRRSRVKTKRTEINLACLKRSTIMKQNLGQRLLRVENTIFLLNLRGVPVGFGKYLQLHLVQFDLVCFIYFSIIMKCGKQKYMNT